MTGMGILCSPVRMEGEVDPGFPAPTDDVGDSETKINTTTDETNGMYFTREKKLRELCHNASRRSRCECYAIVELHNTNHLRNQ